MKSIKISFTWLTLALLFVLPYVSPVFGSDINTPRSPLYPFRSSILIQEDWISGTVNSGTLGWTYVGGSTTGPAGTANHFGLVNRSTSAVSGTLASSFVNSGSSSLYDPSFPHSIVFILRLNTNDANTLVRIGSLNPASLAPTSGIYLEKLDADTNWFCVTNNAGVQTRTNSGIAVTTNFFTMSYTRNSSGVQFFIDYSPVCSHTTNIPTIFISSAFQITNSAASAKTLDVDYYEMRISGIIR